jgi:outer membrane lipoprotein-sorting protein
MKKILCLVIGTTIMALGTSHAQDAKEILEKHFTAIGQEKILNVQTVISEGVLEQMGMEIPFKSITKRPGKAYLEMNIQGSKMITAFDGEKGWAVQPLMGSPEPVDLAGDDLRPMKEMADMDGNLWDYDAKGHQLELIGTEDLDGSEVYVIKLTRKDGNVYHYYFDTEKYLALKMKFSMKIEGVETELVAKMSDYRDIDGYLIPFTTEQSSEAMPGLTFSYKEIKFNEEVDDDLFRKPASGSTEDQ